VQTAGEVTDNVINTYIDEVIIACGRRKNSGGKQYIYTVIM
jgi:hypothetical protein